MIHWVNVVHNSGICLHTCKYCDQEFDEDMQSGLISALLAFAKQLHKENIKEVHMEDNYLLYTVREPIIVVASTTKEMNRKKLSHALNCILDAFFHEYSEFIEQDLCDSDYFTSFSNTIENEFVKNGVSTSLFGKKIKKEKARLVLES